MNDDLYTDNQGFVGMQDFADYLQPDPQQLQEEQDQQIVNGLATGQLVIPSQEDHRRLIHNANARAKFRNSPYLTAEQKKQLIAQTFANDAEIRRSAMPIPPEQRARSAEAQRRQLIESLPPEIQDKPWQFDQKSGTLQYPRGYREPQPPAGSQGDGEDGQDAALMSVRDPLPQETQPENPPLVATKEEYDKLPPGTWYKHPNGTVGLKRGTPKERLKQQFENQYPGLDWEKHQDYPWRMDPRTGRLEIDKELYALQHPKPEKPQKPAAGTDMSNPKDYATAYRHAESELLGEQKRDIAGGGIPLGTVPSATPTMMYDDEGKLIPATKPATITDKTKMPQAVPKPRTPTREEVHDRMRQRGFTSLPGDETQGGAQGQQPQPTVAALRFDTKWKTLKSGETLVGPDGRTYRKR